MDDLRCRMVTLDMYRLFFYFTVIWLVVGITVVCFTMARHFLARRSGKGDHREQ